MRFSILLTIGGIVSALVGCRAAQLRADQRDMREVLLNLSSEQVLNNAARLYLNLPILHVDYGRMTGDVTSTTEASVTGGKDDTDNSFGGPVSASNMTGLVKVSYSLTGKQTNQAKLTLQADPVTEAAVYTTYFQYVAEVRAAEGIPTPKPSTVPTSPFSPYFDANALPSTKPVMRHSQRHPERNAYHLITRVGKEYFWIPSDPDAEARFMKLFADTTLRTKPKASVLNDIASDLNLLRINQ